MLPAGPVGPVRPVAPCGPVAPLAPLAPVAPAPTSSVTVLVDAGGELPAETARAQCGRRADRRVDRASSHSWPSSDRAAPWRAARTRRGISRAHFRGP